MSRWDVIVFGEPLAELASAVPLAEATELRLSYSGDALNAAAAAVTTGASVALLTQVGDDELGAALIDYVARLGIETSLISRVPGQTGAYFVVDDRDGARAFAYLRRGSAASAVGPGDLDPAAIANCRVLVVSGITQAISQSSAAAALEAARLARDAGAQVLYDPNYRPALTTARAAREALEQLAPFASIVTPSSPGETSTLLGIAHPVEAARACRRLGAATAVVTCGPDGVVVDEGGAVHHVPAAPVPGEIVDATGAGDAFAGTLAGRLARDADLLVSVEDAVVAAARAMTSSGGTGHHLGRRRSGSEVR